MSVAIGTRVCVNPPSGRWMTVGFTKVPGCGSGLRLIETTSNRGPCVVAGGACANVMAAPAEMNSANAAIPVRMLISLRSSTESRYARSYVSVIAPSRPIVSRVS
jgi:hypothetical protein